MLQAATLCIPRGSECQGRSLGPTGTVVEAVAGIHSVCVGGQADQGDLGHHVLSWVDDVPAGRGPCKLGGQCVSS